MTVKAVAHITQIGADPGNANKFYVAMNVVGLEVGNNIQTSVNVFNLDGGILAATFELGLVNSVKSSLTTNYGYTFGLFDTVRLLGATLV